ncbi:alpha/beta fold hydrolase [Flavobacterium hercynium]|uniref:Alpha/beta hydrolase n=1 Tax=Flavobacterium hercynium TaxID=387094 RepID=A0A226H6R5_9FLAO|nr:alpha/beta fold hydrolase [Flavobacterium hercynium]OXA89999.1 alpha/beta hydrolase [Flavobacterium hercynium]SMP14279.1 TAP-like protein [Flavobacterium hercynium]
MKYNLKKLTGFFLFLSLFTTCLHAQTANVKLEKTASFFPDEKMINDDNIEWKYLTVPENWDKPQGKTIKLAVAILKSTSKKGSSNPVLFVEGGPGAGEIRGIWTWLQNPIREQSDIVLVDLRGVGFSFPKFCPELGTKFLEILSKNQSKSEDEQQKVLAAMDCKQDLVKRDIDLKAYNSKSIAKDLNALKKALQYENWNVYSVSYGTYTAQVYANDFPQDVKTLILDSSIPDISKSYYNQNTTNYISSLEKVFDACKNDPNCNEQYPNLEKAYYEIIDKLDKKPITVKVDKKIIPTGEFTYNTEDFKVCIQQSLYRKELIQVIPLLITEFNKENKNTLSSLVAAFSGALSLDYGLFYCTICDEALPYNSFEAFNKDAQKNNKLKGGLSFYKSDFLVCDKWNQGITATATTPSDLSNLASLSAPVLVLSGKYDPVTPTENGTKTTDIFKKAYLVSAPVSGHGPSFSIEGFEIVADFLKNPTQKPSTKKLDADQKVSFVTNVKINGGVSNFANSVGELNWLFFAPFIIAMLILIVAIFNFVYTLIRNKKDVKQNKLMKGLIVITSILGLFAIVGFVMALLSTVQDNFYILAFGLSHTFDYLFVIQWIFVALTIFSVLYFALRIKSVSNGGVISTILFSFVLINVYFLYWGFF